MRVRDTLLRNRPRQRSPPGELGGRPETQVDWLREWLRSRECGVLMKAIFSGVSAHAVRMKRVRGRRAQQSTTCARQLVVLGRAAVRGGIGVLGGTLAGLQISCSRLEVSEVCFAEFAEGDEGGGRSGNGVRSSEPTIPKGQTTIPKSCTPSDIMGRAEIDVLTVRQTAERF